MLAWTSLNQFPFPAPIYFCYVAPLAVIAGIAAAGATSGLTRRIMLPWAVALLLFAVLIANRGYIQELGLRHGVRTFDTPLDVPAANLQIEDSEAKVYRDVVLSIQRHLHGGQLVAGPDTPELYFLMRRINPSRGFFEFWDSEPAEGPDAGDGMARWVTGDVIVLNYAPLYSPAPSNTLVARLRREFTQGEVIGQFEVRWR